MSKDRGQGRDPDTVDWIDLAEQAARGEGPAAKLARRALAKRRAQASAAPAAQVPGQPPARAEVIRLPVWVEAVRAVPNMALRSALFGAIRRGPRRYLQRETVAAIEGLQISYTGPRLDQGDLDVWESLLHLVRHQPMGEPCRVTAYALLKLMGKTDTGKNRDVLHTRIERLRANAVTIKQGRYTYIGGLVDEAYKDEAAHQEWVIVLNPKLRPLFAADQFTQVQWSVRQALAGHQLAQWLHGYYASHADPYPMKVETLHKLCGSENGVLRDFRRELREALDAVQTAGGIRSWTIDTDDLVHVVPVRSAAQQRHLQRQSRKPDGTA